MWLLISAGLSVLCMHHPNPSETCELFMVLYGIRIMWKPGKYLNATHKKILDYNAKNGHSESLVLFCVKESWKVIIIAGCFFNNSAIVSKNNSFVCLLRYGIERLEIIQCKCLSDSSAVQTILTISLLIDQKDSDWNQFTTEWC